MDPTGQKLASPVRVRRFHKEMEGYLFASINHVMVAGDRHKHLKAAACLVPTLHSQQNARGSSQDIRTYEHCSLEAVRMTFEDMQLSTPFPLANDNQGIGLSIEIDAETTSVRSAPDPTSPQIKTKLILRSIHLDLVCIQPKPHLVTISISDESSHHGAPYPNTIHIWLIV